MDKIVDSDFGGSVMGLQGVAIMDTRFENSRWCQFPDRTALVLHPDSQNEMFQIDQILWLEEGSADPLPRCAPCWDVCGEVDAAYKCLTLNPKNNIKKRSLALQNLN